MFPSHRSAPIHFAETGQGPTVVLLHGFLEDSRIWSQLAERLSKRFRVVLIDLPGFGKTPGWGFCHTMEDMAAVVNAVADHLGLERFCLLGHSMGGYVTLAFAENWPDRLSAFGLLHSTAWADSDAKKTDRQRAAEVAMKILPAFCSITIPGLFALENRPAHQTAIDELVTNASLLVPKGVVAAIQGMMLRPDRTHVLQNAQMPVLFIQGDRDPVVPLEAIHQQIALNERIEATILPQVAHMGFIESFEPFANAVEDFLGKNLHAGHQV